LSWLMGERSVTYMSGAGPGLAIPLSQPSPPGGTPSLAPFHPSPHFHKHNLESPTAGFSSQMWACYALCRPKTASGN